jgi:hypothetical protein
VDRPEKPSAKRLVAVLGEGLFQLRTQSTTPDLNGRGQVRIKALNKSKH